MGLMRTGGEPPDPPIGFRVTLLGSRCLRLTWDLAKRSRRQLSRTKHWFTLTYAKRFPASCPSTLAPLPS